MFGDTFEITGPAEQLLSRRMGCYWSNFAATGDPNHGTCAADSELPHWPKFRYNRFRNDLDFDEKIIKLDVGKELQVLARFHSERCDVFDSSGAYPW